MDKEKTKITIKRPPGFSAVHISVADGHTQKQLERAKSCIQKLDSRFTKK
jgi:hypothetical protein